MLLLLVLFNVCISNRRWETKAAFDWVQSFKNFGLPVLICLTHADKLYSSTCIGEDGTETCSRDNARRLIQQELEVSKPLSIKVLCSLLLSRYITFATINLHER